MIGIDDVARDIVAEFIRREICAKVRRDEETIRALLGQWVSELEPAVVYQDGEIIGLCVAGAPPGCTPFIFRGEPL